MCNITFDSLKLLDLLGRLNFILCYHICCCLLHVFFRYFNERKEGKLEQGGKINIKWISAIGGSPSYLILI